ncbi:MAG: DUF5790 family protein [Halanaeroarchaeum sp.]
MSQTTLDDDDLFGEAAEEVRADVESHLENARGELPDPDAIWDVEGANALGVLNGLRSSLDVDGARDHLRDAKKWYTMGERADAFEDGEDLADRIESMESLVEDVDTAAETVGELTASIPDLKGRLEELEEDD